MQFDDFDMDEASPANSPAVGRRAVGDAAAVEAADEPPPLVDGSTAPPPTADALAFSSAPSASLFSYDIASLHAAAPAPAPAPAPRQTRLEAASSAAAATPADRDDESHLARSTFAGATAISSADFAMPEQQLAAEPDERQQLSRDVWIERFANSTAISSADLAGDDQSAGGLGARVGGLVGSARTWMSNRRS
jgi:hypothetical protein